MFFSVLLKLLRFRVSISNWWVNYNVFVSVELVFDTRRNIFHIIFTFQIQIGGSLWFMEIFKVGFLLKGIMSTTIFLWKPCADRFRLLCGAKISYRTDLNGLFDEGLGNLVLDFSGFNFRWIVEWNFNITSSRKSFETKYSKIKEIYEKTCRG